MEELLQVKDLSISFHTYNGEVQAVRNASFDLHRKEVLAIVGESGSGKSVTMQTVLKLTPCELKSGQIIFDGKDITHYTDKQMQEIRGSQIGIIFQDAMTSLNPTMKIGRQITESILRHQKVNKAEAKEKALELLVQVGINNPEKRYHQYIHNLSGGMRQRVMIAIALACKPKLLIADEPTTALDVTIQAQIMDLLAKLKEEVGCSIVLITHDLGVVAANADRIAVMSGGVIQHVSTPKSIYQRPANQFVANFIGRSNTLKARYAQGALHFDNGYAMPYDNCGSVPAEDVLVAVRPEEFVLAADGQQGIDATVTSSVFLGLNTTYFVELYDGTNAEIVEESSISSIIPNGTKVKLTLKQDKINVFTADGKTNLTKGVVNDVR